MKYPRTLLPVLLGLTGFLVPAGALGVNLAVTTVQPLSFGRFVAASGTLTMTPAGVRVGSGAVIPLQSDPGQAAQFLVTGDPEAAYSISLPTDGIVALTNGTQSLLVNAFTSSPAVTGILSAGGSQVLRVGARLEVAAGIAVGAYAGSFSVVVEYN